MHSQLEQAHLQMQSRFDRLRDRLALPTSADERSEIHNDLLLLSDDVSSLLKSSPKWHEQKQ
jgi:hypothetical protein